MDNTDETVDGGWLPATRGEVLPDLGELFSVSRPTVYRTLSRTNP
jgi:hypothetical protein